MRSSSVFKPSMATPYLNATPISRAFLAKALVNLKQSPISSFIKRKPPAIFSDTWRRPGSAFTHPARSKSS